MILLDTNVISELARRTPEPMVLMWAQAIPVAELCTTAITEAELQFGLALLAPGARRTALTRAVDAVFRRVLQNRNGADARPAPPDFLGPDYFG